MQSLEVGKQYMVHTVTYAYIGELVGSDLSGLMLKNASIVYDTGNFTNFTRTGTIRESAPFAKPVMVGRAVVVAITEWPHTLPTEAISNSEN